MNCICGTQCIWQSDFNYDEVFCEGEGIVSYYTCPSCGAEIQIAIREDEEESNE